MQSLRIDTHVGTGDSGYTSLPTVPTCFEQSVPSDQIVNSYLSNLDNQNADTLFAYNPDLSNLALQNMNLIKFNDLSRISEEGDCLSSLSKYPPSNSSRPILGAQMGGELEAKLTPVDASSVVSEQTSMWGEEVVSLLTPEQDHSYNRAMETLAMQNTRQLSQKLEVKIRYLLQIFTEANCLDLALLLSILLLDAASVGRITSSAIRSESLAICRQLRNGLKDITRWSFQEWYEYSFIFS